MQSEYSRTYTTFSGADIIATFNGRIIGELQAITYSVTREKGPVYTMGSADPRSFSRGKRGIAGSLVFSVFDRDSFTTLKQESEKIWTAAANIKNGKYGTAYRMDEWDQIQQAKEFEPVESFYADQIPPFSVFAA
jgi:hypothetical protein